MTYIVHVIIRSNSRQVQKNKMSRYKLEILLTFTLCIAGFLVDKGYLAEAALLSGDEHECRRECESPSEMMTCRYNFTVEWFYAMSKACYGCPFNMTDCDRPHCIALNGVQRSVLVVNRMFPGPSVEVCQGDTIIVTVTNHLQNGEGTSIHWHGFPQRGSPYMDGVSMVTQCPIAEFTSFTYEFNAEHAGTHWWHSHSGMQRADGLFGALIVRQSEQDDVHSALYDYDLSEHTVLTHDWLDSTTLDKFAAHHFDNGNNKPESVLINGKGRRAEFFDEGSNTSVYTAREVFHVNEGFRYRFRVISNAIANAPLKISVDGHNLTVIATDGGNIEPVTVDAIVIYGGERFDFVLEANNTPGNYWMRVKGLADAKLVQELAIVRYESAHNGNPLEDENDDRGGIILQDLNQEASNSVYTINQMVAKDESVLPQENKATFYVAFDFYKVNNYNFHDPSYYPIEEIDRSHHLYSPQLNHVSFAFASSPLLTQPSDVTPDQICDSYDVMNMPHCETDYCQCTHVITVALGQTVEFILIDEGVPFAASHPFHLHGHSFRVVGQDRLNTTTSLKEIMELDKAGNIPRNLDHAPLKDTVIVPDGGYTVIQFVADNPGWWFFHCHLEFHLAIGMSLLVHVGSDSDLPPKPDNFPRCGNWPSGLPQEPVTDNPTTPNTGSGVNTQPIYHVILNAAVFAVFYIRM